MEIGGALVIVKTSTSQPPTPRPSDMLTTDNSSSNFNGMERPKHWTQSRRPRRPPCLPTISEHKEFHHKEDYQHTRTVFNSQLIKTRRRRSSSNGFTKPKRFEDDEFKGPEEERPLLGRQHSHKSNKVHDEPGTLEPGLPKPLKRSGFSWKLHKKRVKIVTASWPAPQRAGSGPSPRHRRMLRKALSPLWLLRSMRNVYVRALNSLGDTCNQTMWYSAGARAM